MSISSKQTLILLLVICQGSIDSQAKTVEELMEIADKGGAPFISGALQKMSNKELWGAKRADRSDDIVIINASGTSFSLHINSCSLGSLCPGLLDEESLNGHTSIVLGAQNSKDDEHAYLKCGLYYVGGLDMKTFFSISISSNVHDDVDFKYQSSPNLCIIVQVVDAGERKNNQVIIKVSDRVPY